MGLLKMSKQTVQQVQDARFHITEAKKLINGLNSVEVLPESKQTILNSLYTALRAVDNELGIYDSHSERKEK